MKVSNNISIDGNENIVIQDINGSSIVINNFDEKRIHDYISKIEMELLNNQNSSFSLESKRIIFFLKKIILLNMFMQNSYKLVKNKYLFANDLSEIEENVEDLQFKIDNLYKDYQIITSAKEKEECKNKIANLEKELELAINNHDNLLRENLCNQHKKNKIIGKITKIANEILENKSIVKSDELYLCLKELEVNSEIMQVIIIEIYNILLDYNDYSLMLIITECLASLYSENPKYNMVIQNWLNKGVMGKRAAIRTFSKISEIDFNIVNTSCLLRCCIELDRKEYLTKDEEILKIHLARTIGKIRNTEKGHLLIKTLIQQGYVSKWIAAAVISVSFEKSPPIFNISVMKDKSKLLNINQPPIEELLKYLVLLKKDSDYRICEFADQCENELLANYPQLGSIYHSFNKKNINYKKQQNNKIYIHHAEGTPFSGKLLKVSKNNFSGIQDLHKADLVICLLDDFALENLYSFYEASGILMWVGGILSHPCINLRERKTPFAMIDTFKVQQIPDNTYVVIMNKSLNY
jgi:hypothetical protein